mmetsp:Transcript_6455/g.27160  ORF Transcript_6455/g.27160 Transcript_6455/m.27160 type:complete len:537 (-) Transcript_6455:195-1805(-)
MVVLSAAVLTKSGRCLVARQFVEMNRLRIEGLLAAFPKLMGSGHKQHTFIETDTVRYVWQPVEQIFLLLITNKASNIVEDLDTLRLLSKVVPEVAGGHSEERVAEKVFDLVFALDEVIAPGGYREHVDLRTIRQNLEMDSHEEKLHNMVKKTKMDSAKDQANHMSKVIRTRQKEAAKSGGLLAPGTMAGIGGGGDQAPEVDQVSAPAAADYEPQQEPVEPEPMVAPVQVKSMKLGGKPKGASLLDKMAKEDNLNLAALSLGGSKKDSKAKSAAAEMAEATAPAAAQPVTILVDEKLSCQLSQEGALESFDLKGTLSVTANDESAAKTKVVIGGSNGASKNGGSAPDGLTFQVHPKVLKAEWEKANTLTLKDKDKGFPVGRAVGVLRWSLQTNADDSVVPLVINCWPEDEGDGTTNVNIEYTLQKTELELHNVDITVPLGTSAQPHIVSIDGSHKHLPGEEALVWHLDLVDRSNATGTLEFTVSQDDVAAFFPIALSFTSKNLYYDVQIASVAHTEDGSSVAYSLSKALTADNYRVS